MDQGPSSAPEASETLDVPLALRSASRRLPVELLARQGRRSIAVLSKNRMAELLHRAIAELVDRARAEAREHAAEHPEPPESRWADRLAELAAQMEAENRAREDLEQSRKSLQADLEEVRAELARAISRNREKREDALDRSPYLGVADFDREVDAIVGRILRSREDADADEGTGDRKERARLGSMIHACVRRVVDEERSRIRPRPSENQPLWKLEKRVERLYRDLDAFERAIRLCSSSKTQRHPELERTLRDLGLLENDRYREKKKEMLKVVLETNREIRRVHRDLAARGITLSTPAGA